MGCSLSPLRYLNVKFFCMSIEDFILVRRPLHHAIAAQEWNRLRQYLTEDVALPSQDRMEDAVQKSDGCGLSPLMAAVLHRAEPAILRALAAHKADLEQEDNNGWTALDWSNHVCAQPDVMSLPWHSQHTYKVIKSFLLELLPPCLEFSFDLQTLASVPSEKAGEETLRLLSPKARSRVLLVAAIEIGHGLSEGSSDEEFKRSVTAELDRVDQIIKAMPALPAATPVAFHLNQQGVSLLLSEKADEQAQYLIGSLCGERYRAQHVQLNINSDGVPKRLFLSNADPSQTKKIAQSIAQLAIRHPKTLFLIPVFQAEDSDGSGALDSWLFVSQVFEASKRDTAGGKLPAKNLVALFDDYDSVGEVLEKLRRLFANSDREADGEPKAKQAKWEPRKPKVGFTGGTSAEKLSQYEQLAEEHGCAFMVADSKRSSSYKVEGYKLLEGKSCRDIVNGIYVWEDQRCLTAVWNGRFALGVGVSVATTASVISASESSLLS